LPLPLLAFHVFQKRTGGPGWGAVLTLGYLGGTAVLACLRGGSRGDVYSLMHLTSQVGLLLFAGELLGRRRLWVALVGLLIASWSRQLTGFYAAALIACAWAGEAHTQGPRTPGAGRRRRMCAVAIGLAVIVTVPVGLNWAKFGGPFRTGYALIYTDRQDEYARDCREHGLFSPHFLGRNAYYMNLSSPWVRSAEEDRWVWAPSRHGASIWITSPFLALVLLGARRWSRDVCARILMSCSLAVIAVLLCYHSTGAEQPGYYRFALDFVPIWLVVAADWMTSGWRRWALLTGVAWSVAYFAAAGPW